ncbi:MAG: peptidyl-prolyl cis-trans isomerase [Planctomycetaceae bacterium]|nr:peptidyl-prolyl cis-trans isomerase [Planctomycetaceae bacterium]
MSNPQIVQQGAALLGFVNDEIDKPDTNSSGNSGDDMLSQFLRSDETAAHPNHADAIFPNLTSSTPAFSPTQNTAPPLSSTTPTDLFPSTNAYSNPITPNHNPLPSESLNASPVLPANADALPVTSFPNLPDNTAPPIFASNPASHLTNTPNLPPAEVFPLQENMPLPVAITATTEKNITNNPYLPETNNNKQPSNTLRDNIVTDTSGLDQWSDPFVDAAGVTNLSSPSLAPNDLATPNALTSNVNPPVGDLFSSRNVSVLDPNSVNNGVVNSADNVMLGNDSKNVGEVPPIDTNSIFPDANSFVSTPDATAFPSTQPLIPQTPIPPTTPMPVPPLPPTAQAGTLSLPETSNQLATDSRNGSELEINPSVIAEEVPCIGTETVARVGCEVILMCDILPQLRRFGHRMLRENLNQLTPEQRNEVTQEEKDQMLAKCIEVNYQEVLKMQIEGALVYNDFLFAMPSEQKLAYEKRLNEEFDRKELPTMLKEFEVGSVSELKRFLEEKLGSSIERERMLSTRNKIIQMWIARSIPESEAESTYDELKEYYSQNINQFTTKEQVRWKEMVVLYSKFKTKQEAWDKMSWFVNEVRRGVDFEGLAKLNSDGLTAPEGGVRNWTKKGDISSKILENKIFTMPTKQISEIIEAENGFHVVLVTDHEREKIEPFIDAQANIRKKIKREKLQKKQTEFFENLKQKYYVIVLRKEFNLNMAKPISRPLN